MINRNYSEIHEYISNLQIVDTHEHLPSYEIFRDEKKDFLREYLSHYLSSDLISSGFDPVDYEKAMDTSIPYDERWRLIEPYWLNCRFTGYGRAARIALNDLHGFSDLNSKNIEEVQREYAKTFRPGYIKHILKEKCNIAISVLDNWDNASVDSELYVLSPNINELVMPRERIFFNEIIKSTGAKIESFYSWEQMTSEYINTKCREGLTVFKCSLAYARTLKFDTSDRKNAENEFKKLILPYILDPECLRCGYKIEETANFQNYMMHHILGILENEQVSIQFHTGIQEGNGNYLNFADPLLLINLFIKFHRLRFDLFHMSYPYYLNAGVLAKSFPNVFLDMCWAHIISPTASVNALNEWLDLVPLNKISAFGGDYLFADGVYGHLILARENVSRVLCGKINDGIMTMADAKLTATKIFRENPIEIFRLKV